MKKVLILQDTEMPGVFFNAGHEVTLDDETAALLIDRGQAELVTTAKGNKKPSSSSNGEK